MQRRSHGVEGTGPRDPRPHQNFISIKKKIVARLVTAQIFQSIKTFLAIELSQYRQNLAQNSAGTRSTFSKATDLEMPFVCACPSDPPNLYRIAAPNAQLLILQSKSSIFFWHSVL